MNDLYGDMLHLPHHQSPTRRKMTMIQRAAQFSPFAALTGYDDAIQEEARITDAFIQPGEDGQAVLDARVRALMDAVRQRPAVSVTWFCPDEKKAGDRYVRTEGWVKRIRMEDRELLLTDGTVIPLDAVSALDSDIFAQTESEECHDD